MGCYNQDKECLLRGKKWAINKAIHASSLKGNRLELSAPRNRKCSHNNHVNLGNRGMKVTVAGR
jgi:hypothetical protein